MSPVSSTIPSVPILPPVGVVADDCVRFLALNLQCRRIELDGLHSARGQLHDRYTPGPIHCNDLARRMFDLDVLQKHTCNTSVTEFPPTALA